MIIFNEFKLQVNKQHATWEFRIYEEQVFVLQVTLTQGICIVSFMTHALVKS